MRAATRVSTRDSTAHRHPLLRLLREIRDVEGSQGRLVEVIAHSTHEASCGWRSKVEGWLAK